MKITDTKKLSEIKAEFNNAFPYLKIEFYGHTHDEGEGSQKNDALNSDQTIFDVIEKNIAETIDVSGSMSVAALEAKISEVFEIGAQVFRKSGNIWLQTTTTDHLTLDEQHQKAVEWFEDEEGKNDIPDAMDRLELE